MSCNKSANGNRGQADTDHDNKRDKKQDRFLLHARVTLTLIIIPTANTTDKPFFRSIALQPAGGIPDKTIHELFAG